MNVFSSTLLTTVALTACVSIASAQNKSSGISLRRITGSMPTESLMRNTPHSLNGTPKMTLLNGVLKDIYVEDWGELVMIDAGNLALYNAPSERSGMMETSGGGHLTVAGPVVLPCVGRQNGWFAVSHPTGTVGWVSGSHVSRAGLQPFTERQQMRMYRYAEWDMMCVGVNQETGLVLAYLQRKRKPATGGKALRQLALGQVIGEAYVFHYFIDIDIIRRDKKHTDAFSAVKRAEDGVFDIHVGVDLMIPRYSHFNMIDFQRLPSAAIEYLFGEAIGHADPLDASSYLFVTSELLSEKNEDRVIHFF